MEMNIVEINDNDSLRSFCERASSSPILAVDTEFARERTYYAQLCLLQVGTETEIALIDPFAVTQLEPLLDLFTNPEIVKIFHSCQQDVEILIQQFQCAPLPVHDTQVAATFLGYANQVGYATLIQKELGEKIDKSHTRTDWSKRPLSDAQKKYAANDVRYLPEVYRRQRQQLEQAGRLEWLDVELSGISDPNNYQVNEDKLWRKVKNNQILKGVQLAVLNDLANWRETSAINKNLPRKFILKDDIMVDLARLKPNCAEDLLTLRHFPKSFKPEKINALYELISKARAKPKSEWPKLPDFKRLSRAEELLADSLMIIIKYCASQNSLSNEMLATRKEVDALVRGEKDVALMKGWRHHLAGRIVEEFLEGKLSLQAAAGELQLVGKSR